MMTSTPCFIAEGELVVVECRGKVATTPGSRSAGPVRVLVAIGPARVPAAIRLARESLNPCR